MWERGLRARGAEEDGDLARPESPSRCTLPITALRVMPPSSPAIWLADSPSAQSFFSSSTRSSVHDMSRFPHRRRQGRWRNPFSQPGDRPNWAHSRANTQGTVQYDMSYRTAMKVQYGQTRAQESARLTSTFSCYFESSTHTKVWALSFSRHSQGLRCT